MGEVRVLHPREREIAAKVGVLPSETADGATAAVDASVAVLTTAAVN
jgi:hypothetical protein